MGTIFEEMLRLGTKEEDNHITLLFTIMYYVFVCIWIQVPLYMCIHICVGQSPTPDPILQDTIHFVIWRQGLPLGPGTWLFSQVGWPVSSRDPPVSAPTVLVLQTSITTPGIFA